MRMDFSRGNTLAAPLWAGDFHSRDHVAPWPAKVNAAAFVDANGAIVKLSAAAAPDDVALAVDALPVAIPAGTSLYFQEAKEFALTTADAAKGATSITVQALPTALEDNDEAIYSPTGRKTIKSGTLLGRTYAERDAGTGFGPAVDTDEEIYLLLYDIVDAIGNADAELYRHGSLVFENKLPNFATIEADADLLADLRANYECITRP